jgi:hypothetical protein
LIVLLLERRPLQGSRHGREDNIKICGNEIDSKSMDWIELNQDGIQW